MRIAVVTGRFPTLSETFVLNQITGLIDRGHHVDIFADVPHADQIVHDEVERYGLSHRTHYFTALPKAVGRRILHGIGMLSLGMLRDPTKIAAALNFRRYGHQSTSLRTIYSAWPFVGKSLNYDVIHCHFGSFGLRGMFLRQCGALTGKLVTTFHGADLTEALRVYGNRMYRRLFEAGDLFLPVSQRWKSRLLELGCPAERVVVHRMGIDCNALNFRSREREPDRRIRLLSVCRLVEKKGIKYAVEAVARLVQLGVDVQYDIVGDGPLREQIGALVNSSKLSDRVILHGAKNKQEVFTMLREANILIAPSVTSENGDQEGIPVAIMEAMAVGLPVVSTRHSGIPELVLDGVSGLLVEERDVNALTDRIAYLVSRPGTCVAFGQAGRRIVETEYNIDALNNRLVALFDHLLKNGQSGNS